MKEYETNQMILATLATIIFSTIPNWSFAQATSVKGEDLAKLVDKVSPALVHKYSSGLSKSLGIPGTEKPS